MLAALVVGASAGMAPLGAASGWPCWNGAPRWGYARRFGTRFVQLTPVSIGAEIFALMRLTNAHGGGLTCAGTRARQDRATLDIAQDQIS